MGSFAKLLSAIAELLWPLLVVYCVWLLCVAIQSINCRNFTTVQSSDEIVHSQVRGGAIARNKALKRISCLVNNYKVRRLPSEFLPQLGMTAFSANAM